MACVDAREDLQPLRAEMSRAGAWVIASDVLRRHVPGGDVVDGGGVVRARNGESQEEALAVGREPGESSHAIDSAMGSNVWPCRLRASFQRT